MNQQNNRPMLMDGYRDRDIANFLVEGVITTEFDVSGMSTT